MVLLTALDWVALRNFPEGSVSKDRACLTLHVNLTTQHKGTLPAMLRLSSEASECQEWQCFSCVQGFLLFQKRNRLMTGKDNF